MPWEIAENSCYLHLGYNAVWNTKYGEKMAPEVIQRKKVCKHPTHIGIHVYSRELSKTEAHLRKGHSVIKIFLESE